MVHSTLLGLVTLAATGAAALDFRRFTSQRSVAQNLDLPTAPFVTSLTQKVPRRASKKQALRDLRQSASKLAVLSGSDDDEEYATGITIGGLDFQVIVDTGSSDLFLAKTGFQCFDLADNPVPESQCLFGTSGFDPTKSKTFEPFPDKNFNISFGDAEFLTGEVGFDTVTVGGLKVTHQEFSLATKAAWDGDGVTTGLIGFAYPGLTSVFNGTDPDADVPGGQLIYNPFFFSAVQQKAVAAPFFSVALDRGTFAARSNSTFDPNLGFFAFGGIAPVPVTNTAVTVPVQGFETASGGSGFFFYSVAVDAYTFPGSNKAATQGGTILDTGTTLNILPTDVAEAYNARFEPPGTLDPDSGLFLIDCNATAPPFAAVIGGKSFSVDGRDNIIPSLQEDGTVACFSGVQDGGPDEDGNIFILGDVFLHNVVATFDVANNTITLHERTPY